MPNRLIHFLAPARIARYRSFLKISADEEVYRAYCWNYAISASVFPLIGSVEMHLRDAVHRELARKYAPPGTPNPHSYAWYNWNLASHFPLKNKSRDDVESLLYDKKTGLLKARQPSTDDVIASLTFGFWTNLLRSLHPVDVPKIIPAIFPRHFIKTPGQWGNKLVRQSLIDHLNMANDFRNRVAHHEPLFKFRHGGAYPTTLKQGLTNLRSCVDECMAITGWISSAAHDALLASTWYSHFRELTTVDCFNSCVRLGLPGFTGAPNWRCAEFATKTDLLAL